MFFIYGVLKYKCHSCFTIPISNKIVIYLLSKKIANVVFSGRIPYQ